MDTDPCQVIRNMGLDVIVLELDQRIAVLVSYLDSLTRTRELKLRFPNVEHIEAFLPIKGHDHTRVRRNSAGRTPKSIAAVFGSFVASF